MFALVGFLIFCDKIRMVARGRQTFSAILQSKHLVAFNSTRSVEAFSKATFSSDVVSVKQWVDAFQTRYKWSGVYSKTTDVKVRC